MVDYMIAAKWVFLRTLTCVKTLKQSPAETFRRGVECPQFTTKFSPAVSPSDVVGNTCYKKFRCSLITANNVNL